MEVRQAKMRDVSQPKRITRPFQVAPFAVLALGLLTTALVTLYLLAAGRTEDETRFENGVQRILRRIEDQARHYTSLLEAGAGIFAFREDFGGAEFQSYVERFYDPGEQTGVQGIGFARRVRSQERERFLREVEQEIPSFELVPPGERPEYFPIVYLIPQDRRNQVAVGFDMFSEENRREAMSRARDTGSTVTSGPVTLVQEIDERKQVGFLIYAPAYKDGVVPAGVEERRRDLVGFVYSPFRADDFIAAIFSFHGQPRVHFEVYDGDPGAEALLHRSPIPTSRHPRLTATRHVEMPGRAWTILFSSTPDFEAASRQTWIPFIAGSGLLLSLLLFGIAAALTRAHARAEASQREESEQRERLRVTLSSIGDAVIATDPAGNVAFMNPVAERLTGWPFSEADQKPLHEIFHIINEETREPVTDPVRKVLAERRVIGLANHTVLIARDGTERAIADSAAPIEDSTGATRGVVLVFQDVTERQQARRALQESEARSSAILETALDAIVTSNEAGEIIEWNPAAEKIFGYTRGEVVGRQMSDLIIPPAWREQHRKGMERYLTTGETRVLGRRIEITAMRKGGEEFPVELGIIRLSTKGPAQFTAHIRDITARKQAETDLKTLATKLSNTLKSISDAFISVDREWRFTYANPKAAELLGHGPDELLGEVIWDLFPKSRESSAYDKLLTAMNSQTKLDFEHRSEVLNLWLEVHAYPSEEGLSVYFQDITERKKAEEALREAQEQLNQHAVQLEKTVAERTAELQEVIGELEAFSYSISHDMRAPLRAIEGMAGALLEDYGDKIETEGVDFINRIMAAALRMDRLIQDVLSYSRVIRNDIELTAIDLEHLVGEIIGNYPELQAANADVHIRRPLLKVMGQEASLTQCLSNLLGNAVKFVPPGKKPRIEVWTEEVGNDVRLSIRDNGVGIDPRHQERIFMIFERVHPETEFPGTGIGLAIVKKGVERMGGTIGVESEPGEGSTFWIQLAKASDDEEHTSG